MKNYDLEAQDGKARAGILHTRKGSVQTPLFFSVATRGAIKAAVSVDDLKAIKAPFVLANTYHLHLRPTSELVAKMGGLHKYMKWDGPIITDSGGFQVFSIQRKKITDEGVYFNSHIDGKRIYIDAEKSMEIQNNLGSDIVMAFDECPPNVPKWHKIRRAVERTTEWAKRSLKRHQELNENLAEDEKAQLFGIVQGGCYPDLRQRSLEEITSLPFDGYAMGGLAVGEPPEEMYKVLDEIADQLPADKPRYLMGVGTPTDLLESIERGVDMFDCVMPMRNARHGTVFTWEGRVKIENAEFKEDEKVLDPNCPCPVCQQGEGYSRSYIRHLMHVGEDLGKRLVTIHNMYFYQDIMKQAREHIVEGDFSTWKEEQVKKWAK